MSRQCKSNLLSQTRRYFRLFRWPLFSTLERTNQSRVNQKYDLVWFDSGTKNTLFIIRIVAKSNLWPTYTTNKKEGRPIPTTLAAYFHLNVALLRQENTIGPLNFILLDRHEWPFKFDADKLEKLVLLSEYKRIQFIHTNEIYPITHAYQVAYIKSYRYTNKPNCIHKTRLNYSRHICWSRFICAINFYSMIDNEISSKVAVEPEY